jgi:hypothetical protein
LIEHLRLRKKPCPSPLLRAVSQLPLEAGFCCGSLPEGSEFGKILSADSPLHQADGVNVAEVRRCMAVMDGRDKRDSPADVQLHLPHGQARDVL